MREVMNRVLAVAGSSAAPRIRPATGKQVQALPDLLSLYPDLSLYGQGESVPVPKEVADVFDKLIRTSVQEKRRSRDDVASLLTDDGNNTHLAVQRWIELRDFFVRWAHLGDEHTGPTLLPSNEYLRAQVTDFDELFDAVITAFFTLRHSIDDLLAEINAGWEDRNEKLRIPDPAGVQATLRKIPTVQLRRVFYEGLNNPLWVRPLLDAGAFSSPPEPTQTEDGYIRDTYWPEISFLTRIAPSVPVDVVDALLPLNNSSNGWVRRAIFEIGSGIPATEGARLRPLLEAWKTSGFGWRTDPTDMVSFAIKLLEGGETKTGRWLANALFAPQPPDSGSDHLSRPQFALESYWYEEELPRIIPALGEDALKALTGWLMTYVVCAGHVRDGYDSSAMIRPSMRERDDSPIDPEEALVEAVRDLAIPAMLRAPAATAKVLLSSGIHLLCKIAVYAMTEAIRQSVDSGADAKHLVRTAEQLLGCPGADDEHLRFEYAQLAQAVAPVQPDALGMISEFMALVYGHDLEWMRDRLVDHETGEKASETEIHERAERHRHSWLSTIGAEALPPELHAELVRLDGAFGPINDPGTPPGMIRVWSGPNPFCTQDEMAAMKPMALVAFLAGCHDTGDGWGPEPTHDGQARELAALLTTHPRAVSGVPNLISQLRPTYVRAILQGWEAALKAGLELDWRHVADLIAEVLAHTDASSFPLEGGSMDDDEDFRRAKNAAVGLLEELVKQRDGVSIPDDLLRRFANLVIEQASDETARTEYDKAQHDGNSSDPLTMSLNWQWPKRLRALFHLATDQRPTQWQPAAFAAIETELDRPDRHGASRAVLGQHLGKLLMHAPDWLTPRLADLFGTADEISVPQQIALSTAITVHRYHRDLYDLLHGPMIAALSVGDDLVSGWRTQSKPVEQIGEWVIDALIYGHQSMDDPLAAAFFTIASAHARGKAIGTIAWSFFRAEHVDDAIRDRFAQLWDERIKHVKDHPEDHEELKGFCWCARGNKFPTEWWLPRMQEALELEPGIASERYMIGKELAAASAEDPKHAFAVLRLLLEARDATGLVSHNLTLHAVPVVIANAISARDKDLKRAAEGYMNELGARGNLELEAQVRAVIVESATQDAIED